MELIMVGKLGINHKTHVALPSKHHVCNPRTQEAEQG